MNSNIYPIRTERLEIKPSTPEDADLFLELFNTESWLRYIGDRNVRTLAQARKYIQEKMLTQYERLGFSNNTLSLISNGSKIGSAGLYEREGMEDVDIGFALLPEYEKQGYALEAATAIIAHAHQHFRICTVSGYTTEDNASSRKLLERLGLSYRGTATLAHDDEDLLWYQLQIDSN